LEVYVSHFAAFFAARAAHNDFAQPLRYA